MSLSGAELKVTLVFYEPLATGRQSAFGYASYRLARNLLERGWLDQVICRAVSPEVELPRDKVLVMHDDPLYRFAARLIARAGQMFPWFNARRILEEMFDRFVSSRMRMEADSVLFTTRPLILNTIRKAKAARMKVWLFASVPHPLVNFSLGRNEELRYGLPKKGPITDVRRTERLAGALALADKVVSMGPEIGEYVFDSFRNFVEPDRLLGLKRYFPVDPAEYAALTGPRPGDPEKRGVTFLHVSHIVFLKGITYLLEAWRIFKKNDRSGSRLLLVGAIDRPVRELVDREFGDLEGVEFRGFVPDLMPHFKEADVFVSPSVTDAGPVTIIEAMASGLPVISSNNCGFASLLTEGHDGFRYQFNDVRRLAEILEHIAANPGDLPRLSKNAFDNAQGRSLEEYVDELTELFGECGL